MTELNVLQADISQRLCFTSALYQWDYGQVLLPTGVELPSAYEVHFTVPNTDTTMTVIGNADGVAIPDELLQSSGQIVAYIYLHEGEDDGETEYKINIPVKSRPQPSDYEPTPVEQDIITQTVAALNTAVDYVDTIAENLSDEIVDTVQTELAEGDYKGEKGDKGDTGEKGEKGDTGIGIPVGGTTGQVLAKASDADYDTAWINQQGGGSSDYNDLTNKPSINGVTLEGDVTISVPSKTSELVNDSGFLTAIPSEYVTDTELQTAISGKANTADLATVATSGSYNDLSNIPTIPTVPTNVSAFTNDAGYITSAPVQSVNGQTGAVVISTATTSADGLLSATDKGRLDALYDDYSSAMTALGV